MIKGRWQNAPLRSRPGILVDTIGATDHLDAFLFSMKAGLILCLSVTMWMAPCSNVFAAEEGFIPMFNGRDLEGWEGQPGWWTVEDGAITSESTPEKPCLAAHYLMWRGDPPADFDLRLEFRLVGGNSGIQFRSRELPGWDTSGYQADIEDGDQWTGCLFEHTRGGVAMRGERVIIAADGTKTTTALGDSQELLRQVRKREWNTYRIVAKGPEIVLEINGVVMAQATDRQEGVAARDGVIALQMHPGPPMKVQFRNLRIRPLPASASP